jgi:hypothetical protein
MRTPPEKRTTDLNAPLPIKQPDTNASANILSGVGCRPPPETRRVSPLNIAEGSSQLAV